MLILSLCKTWYCPVAELNVVKLIECQWYVGALNDQWPGYTIRFTKNFRRVGRSRYEQPSLKIRVSRRQNVLLEGLEGYLSRGRRRRGRGKPRTTRKKRMKKTLARRATASNPSHNVNEHLRTLPHSRHANYQF